MNACDALYRADFLDLSELAAVQQTRWSQQAAYVGTSSRFYRNLLGKRKLTGDVRELADIPFTDKDMLREDQNETPPFGSYLASDADAISRVHRTSGTTGVAMNLAL